MSSVKKAFQQNLNKIFHFLKSLRALKLVTKTFISFCLKYKTINNSFIIHYYYSPPQTQLPSSLQQNFLTLYFFPKSYQISYYCFNIKSA